MERNAEGDVAVSIGDHSKPLLSRHGREAWSAPPPSPLSRGSRFQLAPSSFQAEVSSDESTPIANFILEQGKMDRSSSTHNASKWKNLRSRLMPLAIMKTGLARGNKHSKKLLTLILLNVAYSTAQLLVGLLTGRIGLVSDSFHLTFGCGVLSFSLFAMFMAKKEGDDAYTYGYKRLEVLAAFTNTLFLLFLSFSLGVEALHAFIQDESEHKHYLIVSAVTNLFVNLLGVWFFRNFARLQFVYKKAEDMNNHSIFLHVLSDSIRSAGVILASWLLMLGVTNAEILCLGLVAVAIFLLTFPLFKASGGVLLQMAPNGIPTSVLNKCLRQVRVLQDVKEIYQARFWEMVPGFVVGTLVLRVRNGANEQSILKHVHSIYNDIGVQDITVQIEVDQT